MRRLGDAFFDRFRLRFASRQRKDDDGKPSQDSAALLGGLGRQCVIRFVHAGTLKVFNVETAQRGTARNLTRCHRLPAANESNKYAGFDGGK